MKSNDTFSDVDGSSDPAAFAEFLDAAGKLPGVAEIKRLSFDELKLAHGNALLDVGAGRGDDLALAAELVGPQGRVVGLDKSKTLLDIARRRLSSPVFEFCLADACDLPFAASTFDAIRADRVLLHIDKPLQVIAEMSRVLRPGGRMVIFDLDWATLLVDHPHQRLSAAILQAVAERHRHPWLGRSLARLIRGAGLLDIIAKPAPIILDFPFFSRLCRDTPERVADRGAFSLAEIAQWRQDLRSHDEEGRFVASIVGYLVRGKKPKLVD